MPAARPPAPAVVEVNAVVRRVIGARVRDPHDREDLVQATLVKIAAAQRRLGDEALQGYAIVTARHVVADHFRRETTHRRHIHRLVEYTTLDSPEELTLRREETNALAAALARLDPADRHLLLAHEVDGVSTADLAAEHASTPGGVAVHLARARARLRLEFLLVFRNVELPTKKCRPVLLALSSGERRRQLALHTAEHLLECETCASLSTPLVERRRSIAGFLPFVGVRPLLAGVRRVLKNPRVQVGVGVTAVAGVVVVGALAMPASRPPAKTFAVRAPSPPRPVRSPLTSGGHGLLPIPSTGLSAYEGRAVIANNVKVLSAPANEGAWVGTDARNHVWVEFIGPGESPFTIVPGQRLTFTGQLVRNPPTYTETLGLPPGIDAQAINRMGLHIAVGYNAVRVTKHA
jgi:RNA polymerase sigma factor (sigma-70 family)